MQIHRQSPSSLTSATVHLPPDARTPWKINPAGQTLVVLSGLGRVQTDGEDVVEVVPPPASQHSAQLLGAVEPVGPEGDGLIVRG